MNRRKFLRDACATAATISCASRHVLHAQESNQPISATLTIDESAALATIPEDFIGLSYESAQLANPAFFAAENTALIALFCELGDQGVLRLGGGTSEFTAFTTDETPALPPLGPVVIGPDNSKNVKSDTPVLPKSLRNLRAFLDTTNWRCLYGLNLGRGPVERAAAEAFYAQSILGPRLIAFQLGNEPDAWRNRYRPATWSYADYWMEWWWAVPDHDPEALRANLEPSAPDFFDYTTADWYVTPERTGKRHVAGPYVDYVCTNEYAMTLAQPVRAGTRFVGVAALDVSVAGFETRVLPALRTLGAAATLVNGSGRVIASTSPEAWPGQRASESAGRVIGDASTYGWRILADG